MVLGRNPPISTAFRIESREGRLTSIEDEAL